MKPDLYRLQRRRLRADLLLIERGVNRETRRRIWRLAALEGFTSLSRAIRDESLIEVWRRVFFGDPGWFDLGCRRAGRRARKAHSRRAQRERMARHREAWRGVCENEANPGAHNLPTQSIAEWGAAFEAMGRTEAQ